MQLEKWEAIILLKVTASDFNNSLQSGEFSYVWLKERLIEMKKYLDFLDGTYK
jgi:hypothetical protein